MDLTRRGLLGRAAAATGVLLGGSLVGPRLVFAGAAGEAVFELRVPRGGGPVEARRTFELIGIEGAQDGTEVRARGLDGRWSEWLPVHSGADHGPDAARGSSAGPDAARGSARGASAGSGARAAVGSEPGASARSAAGASRGSTLSDPVWTGPGRAFQARPKRPLGGARVILVDGGRGATASARTYVDAQLPAAAGQPKVIARSSW